MKLGTESELTRVFEVLSSGALIFMLAAAGSGIRFLFCFVLLVCLLVEVGCCP
jgi:hypothetical protein